MAARHHRVSRRALLGAAVAAPVLSVVEWPVRACTPPSSRRRPGPSLDRWNRALARFRRAEAALAAAAHEPDEDLYDAINAAFHNALRRLLRTPAPDLAALADKIELGIDQEIATLTGGESCLASLKRDTHRLCRQG